MGSNPIARSDNSGSQANAWHEVAGLGFERFTLDFFPGRRLRLPHGDSTLSGDRKGNTIGVVAKW